MRGINIFRVLDCRPMIAETGGKDCSKLTIFDEFTARLAACGGLESVINTSLDALSALFGYDDWFLMVPDEEGKRLFTLGSRWFAKSGIGSETWIGEGILGIAAERHEVV